MTEDMLADPDLALEQRIDQAMQDENAFMDEPGAREGCLKQITARASHDCYDKLGRIAHETLVCGGVHDGVAPREAVKALAQNLPNATLRWYGGGHGFLTECPEFFSDCAAFLDGAS